MPQQATLEKRDVDITKISQRSRNGARQEVGTSAPTHRRISVSVATVRERTSSMERRNKFVQCVEPARLMPQQTALEKETGIS